MTYQHKEAFCLMYYKCKCGHMERFWNSRDGVTPFGTRCPSCGDHSLMHAFFGSDDCKPDYKPHKGQRVWVDMTPERAKIIADKRIQIAKSAGFEMREGFDQATYDDIYRGGRSPDLIVWGYEEKI